MAKPPAKNRLLFADLKGSPKKKGEVYGEMFKDQIKESGIVDFYTTYCEKAIYQPSAMFRSTLRFFHTLVAARHTDMVKEVLTGFCRSTGYNYGLISRGLVMADVLNYLAGLAGNLPALPSFGCTSVAVWDSYTRNGNFLYARNLDFPGNGYWDVFPVITRYRPDKGIPYVSISTAGSIVDGITGINEEGLTVALHQHLSTDVSILKNGRPIIDLANEVLMNARTIEQAIELCRGWVPTSGWTLVFTQWKERRACVVEKTPRFTSVQFHNEGKMVRTNDFVDPVLKNDEIDFRPWRESSRLRRKQADAIVEKEIGRLDTAALSRLLCDHTDADRGVFRAFGQTLAQPHNMTSVVFDPEDGTAWVADAKAPVSQGTYRKFSLWDGGFGKESLPAIKDPLSTRQREAYRIYITASVLWQKSKDNRAVLELLTEVMIKDPNDPIYRYMHGLFSLKCRAYKAASKDFAKGASMPDLAHRTQAQKLWQGRSLDLLGRRSEAVRLYKEVSHHTKIARGLRRAAVHGVLTPYSARLTDKLMPDFILGDVYQY